MTEQEKIAVVVVAHADDAEFGCAGTVARWVREGWTVYYLICADGGSGGSDEATDVGPAARQKVVETREAEQRAACAVLGVRDVFFLRYPDGRVQPTLELRRDIVRVLRRCRPSRVICFTPDRSWSPSLQIGAYHPDHLAVGQAAMAALYPAVQNPWDFPELLAEGLKPHKVSEIYVIEAPAPNFVVDISADIETKIAALRAHASQFTGDMSEIEKLIRDWAAETGARHGHAYAEEFHRAVNG